MRYKIKPISSSDTLAIRHEVMWPNKPLEYIKLENDEEGKHFGLFVSDKLIAIISLFDKNGDVQFRKFATLNAFQGKGYGTILLEKIIDLIENEGHRKIWCNARGDKTEFYTKFGLKLTNNKFVKGGIEYVIMEKTFANFIQNHSQYK